MCELAPSESVETRDAAIKALGVVVQPERVSALVKLAVEPKSAPDRKEIESSLGRVLLRIENPADRAEALLNAIPNVTANVRPLLILQLAKAGTPGALIAVRTAFGQEGTRRHG